MQKFVALCAAFALVAVVCSEELKPTKEPVPIVKSESNVQEDGSYTFTYEGGDGNFREETGSVVNAGTDDESIKVSGSYKYIDADGVEVSVQYTADENGFVPIGSNIPKEISDAAIAAKDLPNEEVDHAKKH